MPFTLKKKATVVVEETQLSDYAELIDRIGALQPGYERTKKKIKELALEQEPYTEAVKELQTLLDDCDQHGDDEEFKETGAAFIAEIGKKATARSIKDIKKVKKLMGDKTFYDTCTVALKHIDAYLTPEEQLEVLDYIRGLRGVKVLPRPKAKK